MGLFLSANVCCLYMLVNIGVTRMLPVQVSYWQFAYVPVQWDTFGVGP